MKQLLIKGIRNNVSKSLGSIAMKSGEAAMERCCMTYNYEPAIPVELLKMSSKSGSISQ